MNSFFFVSGYAHNIQFYPHQVLKYFLGTPAYHILYVQDISPQKISRGNDRGSEKWHWITMRLEKDEELFEWLWSTSSRNSSSVLDPAWYPQKVVNLPMFSPWFPPGQASLSPEVRPPQCRCHGWERRRRRGGRGLGRGRGLQQVREPRRSRPSHW